LECDLRLTRDGQLVCIHDRRIDRTSDGSGVISTLTLEQLRRFDFASWHEEHDKEGQHPDDHGVLTLEELLGLMKDSGRPLKLLAETKHPNRYAGRVERQLALALRRFGWTRAGGDYEVTVMSFASIALRRMRALDPTLPLVLLMDSTRLRRTGLLPTGVGIAGPSIEALRADPSYVERAHGVGNRVFVWTVDEPADLRYVLNLGVDAVITNRPGETVAALR
jgi:glycerophosphoryl diester phosphodiesterase